MQAPPKLLYYSRNERETMTAIAELTPANTLEEILHSDYSYGTGEWIGDYYVHLRRHGDESLTIIDGRNAFKNKSVCPQYRICGGNSFDCPVLNSDWMDLPLEDIVEVLEDEFEPKVIRYGKSSFTTYEPIEADGLTLYRSDESAKNCFNVNALDRLKRVKSLPAVGKTVRLPTVVKLLVNGQVSVHRDLKLTDDYLYDSVSNFGKGDYPVLALAERLVESPSGWRAYMREDGKLMVACHSFEYHTLSVTDKKLL